jgi:hypothetical protein
MKGCFVARTREEGSRRRAPTANLRIAESYLLLPLVPICLALSVANEFSSGAPVPVEPWNSLRPSGKVTLRGWHEAGYCRGLDSRQHDFGADREAILIATARPCCSLPCLLPLTTLSELSRRHSGQLTAHAGARASSMTFRGHPAAAPKMDVNKLDSHDLLLKYFASTLRFGGGFFITMSRATMSRGRTYPRSPRPRMYLGQEMFSRKSVGSGQIAIYFQSKEQSP